MNKTVFVLGLLVNAFLLGMVLASRNNSKFQYWPPPCKSSWQYHTLWWSIRTLVACIGWFIFVDYSSIALPDWLRFYFALPGFIVTFLLGVIATVQLGWANTHGIAHSFVKIGLYNYSRNPQYVFYSMSFVFLGLWAASLEAMILLLFLSCWYLRAPFSEEIWLERQYGETYLRYKNRVPRYLGWTSNAQSGV